VLARGGGTSPRPPGNRPRGGAGRPVGRRPSRKDAAPIFVPAAGPLGIAASLGPLAAQLENLRTGHQAGAVKRHEVLLLFTPGSERFCPLARSFKVEDTLAGQDDRAVDEAGADRRNPAPNTVAEASSTRGRLRRWAPPESGAGRGSAGQRPADRARRVARRGRVRCVGRLSAVIHRHDPGDQPAEPGLEALGVVPEPSPARSRTRLSQNPQLAARRASPSSFSCRCVSLQAAMAAGSSPTT
jgi:hypothetical protein